jgi:hypothetical protein
MEWVGILKSLFAYSFDTLLILSKHFQSMKADQIIAVNKADWFKLKPKLWAAFNAKQYIIPFLILTMIVSRIRFYHLSSENV